MTKLVIIFICLGIFSGILSETAHGLVVPGNIGTGSQVPNIAANVSCNGPWWSKIVCVTQRVANYIATVQRVTRTLDYLPHLFPFGGPILSSQRACEFKFDSWTRFPNPACATGFCTPPTIAVGPVAITIPLTGRGIIVGPPVPTYTGAWNPNNPVIPPGGRVIAFPWISQIYQNHTENRAGPWALGVGFSPFPLGEINDALGDITIWIPPLPLDPPCGSIYARMWLTSPPFEECIDNIRFDCSASGERDASGNAIYKVILKLGTSGENAPDSAFPPGFPIPRH